MIVAAITRSGEILYAALNQIGELEAVDMEPVGTALGADYEAKAATPTPSPGISIVGLSADRRTWIEQLGSSTVGFENPFDHVVPIDPQAVTITDWFKDAHIARFETPWQDLSEPARLKNWHEVEITLDRDARAYVGVYAETESGDRAYKFKGSVHGSKRPVRLPINLLGTRIRVRVVMVTFNGQRVLVRDMRLGYTPAGAD